MATTEYLPVAVAAGAYVDPQSSFAGSSYQQVGFTTGTAKSAQANKVWRQSSMMASAWATLIVNTLAQNVPDDGNLNNLVGQLQSVVNYIAAAALNASGLAQRVSALETLTAGHSTSIGALNTTVSALQGQYNSLAARVSAAEGTIVSNTNNITSLLGRVANLETLYSSLNNSLTSLQGNFNALYTQVQGIQGQINNINGEISTLQTQTGTNTTNIAGNTTSINTLNGEIPPINAHLGNLDQQVANLMPTGSLAVPGWTRLPNGLIMQWATGVSQSAASTQTQTVNFPIAFSTVFQVQVTTVWQSSTDDDIMEYQVVSWNMNSVYLRRARRGNDNTTASYPVIFAIGK